MKLCPRCGFANLDSRDRCLRCRAVLGHDPGVEPLRVRRRLETAGLRRRLRQLGRATAAAVRPRLPVNVPHRFPLTAALSGVVPGLGQIYNRQALKAVYILAGWLALGALTAWRVFDPRLAYPTLFAWAAFWLYGAADAMATAIRINGQAWTPRQTWGAYFALASIASAVWFVTVFLASPLVYFRLIDNGRLAPVFQRGDFIWLDKWCLWFGGEPRRGEYIYYDPAGFTMHQGQDAILYDAQNFIERVIGLPGETVVVRRGADGEAQITVDGEPLPRDLYPISTRFLPPHREFVIPGDRWLILQSTTMPDGFIESLLGAPREIGLSGIDFEPERRWTQSCLVAREQMIGRVFAISHPPERRRWFERGER